MLLMSPGSRLPYWFLIVVIFASIILLFKYFGGASQLMPIAFATSLSAATALVYFFCADDFGDRIKFAKVITFVGISVALIIGLIKGSLALSLGLVGALSIVRFRTPIKDPLQLTFLFIAIAIGIGAGAEEYTYTSIAALTLLALILLTTIAFPKSKGAIIFKSNVVGKIDFKEHPTFSIERDLFSAPTLKVTVTHLGQSDGIVNSTFTIESVSIADAQSTINNEIAKFNKNNQGPELELLSLEFWQATD